MVKKIIFVFVCISLFSLGLFIYPASSQASSVCCEETISGAFCQNVPQNECATGGSLSTNCDNTGYCKAGTCVNPIEGTCLDNVPDIVCGDNGGNWYEESPLQCELGCCILGNQAALVTLVRCNRLSSTYGLETNYDGEITDEALCIDQVRNQDVGACVYTFEFENHCAFTTKAECDDSSQSSVDGVFYKGKLCTHSSLNTICGPSEQTTCVPGKDEVYFVDTCGNRANVYDSSRQDDLSYWNDLIDEIESCGFGTTGNVESKTCGNCDYLLGSYCRDKSVSGIDPDYGDFICADLNCKETSNGENYLHGEAWCVNSDEGETGDSTNSVGSRFYRHVCINGEEVLDPCEDFRNEVCLQEINEGYSYAACKPNRFEKCFDQDNQLDCENIDQGDCIWREDIDLISIEGDSGTCFPRNSPGQKFWESETSQALCSLGTAQCVVTYTKKLGRSYKCKKNCECEKKSWYNAQAGYCSLLGDCGPSINWRGEEGYTVGWEVKKERIN